MRDLSICLNSAVGVARVLQNPPLHAPQVRKTINTETLDPGQVQSCLMLLDLWHGHPTTYGRALDPRATHCSQEMILFLFVHEAAGSWKPSHFCRRSLSLFLSSWKSEEPSQESMPCLPGGWLPPTIMSSPCPSCPQYLLDLSLLLNSSCQL